MLNKDFGKRDNEDEILKKAITRWGKQMQEKIFIEEIGEVLTAWSKKDRVFNGCDEIDFIYELIDLEISLQCMKLIYNIDKEIWNKRKEYKFHKIEKYLKEY